jgi:hypothetical protein
VATCTLFLDLLNPEVCDVCKTSIGACIQCAYKTCRASFHPQCAAHVQSGFSLRLYRGDQIIKLAACRRHLNPDGSLMQPPPPPPKPVRKARVKEEPAWEEEEEEEEESESEEEEDEIAIKRRKERSADDDFNPGHLDRLNAHRRRRSTIIFSSHHAVADLELMITIEVMLAPRSCFIKWTIRT